nr:sarcosine oxidase subunit gamma family protein [Acidimangrovimonas sediminis]
MVKIREAGACGMITLRGNFASEAFVSAVKSASGLDLPGIRQVVRADGMTLGWMSPDELMLMLPYAEVPGVLARLNAALAGEHALAVDVSDARAVFVLTGTRAREVLAKLSPADLAPGHFAEGELRRTRLAQVPAAFWMTGEAEVTLFCFRSVAGYVMGLLTTAAAPGGEVGAW